MRDTHTGHDARCADRTGTDAHFHRVGAGFRQHFCGLSRGNVAHHDVYVGEFRLGFFEFFDNALGVAVRRVDDDGIDTGIDQRFDAFHRVGCHPYAGGYTQTAFRILTSHGFVFGLRDILISNESDQSTVGVYHGKFLNFVLLQNFTRARKIGGRVGRHEVFARHHFVNLAIVILFKAQVAVGHNTHELHVVVHYGDTADVIFGHERQGIADCFSALDGHGIVDHAVFGTLHDGHLASLLFDRHVFVNHTDAAFTSDGDRHGGFGHSVHGGCHEGDVQLNVARKVRGERHRAGQDFGISGDKQDVVVSETVHHNFVGNEICSHKAKYEFNCVQMYSFFCTLCKFVRRFFVLSRRFIRHGSDKKNSHSNRRLVSLRSRV